MDNPYAFETDLGLEVPFEVYSSMNGVKNGGGDYMQFTSDFPSSMGELGGDDWISSGVLDSVMGGFPVVDPWNGGLDGVSF